MLYNGNCGPYKGAKPVTEGVFWVDYLNVNTKPYFKLLKLTVADEKIFFEQKLIENRSGLTLGADTKICVHHRYTLGKVYKPKKTCLHPHNTQQPKVKAAAITVASFSVIDHITKNYGSQFPICGAVCTHVTRRNQFPKCLSWNQNQPRKKMIQIMFQRWW